MWNTLIRARASSQNPNKVIFLYINIRRIGFVLNQHTFTFVLKACSNVRSLNCYKQIHTHVSKSGLDLDFHVVNCLVRSYSISSDLNNARQVFDAIRNKTLNVWTTMIFGYAQSFRVNEVFMMFDQMLIEGFEPNNVTLASVLSAWAQSGCLELGEKVHVFIKKRGFEMRKIFGTALVHMYTKNGTLGKAKALFYSMPTRNIATRNAIIYGLASHGHAKEALDLFRKLENEQIVANDITFIGVLSACCHDGFIDVGHQIFSSIKRVYDIEAKIEHYGCMVDLLGRGGKTLEAEELIKRMMWKPDVVMWGALLVACKNHGNVEVAERVVKEIIALEPNNHGIYVVLSNMYTEAERWEDVTGLRSVMKQGKLKKTLGWSLVDGDK